MYNATFQLMDTTQEFEEKIFRIFDEKLKEVNCCKLYQDLRNQDNITESMYRNFMFYYLPSTKIITPKARFR